MKTIFTLFLSTVSALTFGQTNIPSYGMVTNEEKNLKECSFDKSASAIVLLDVAQSTYNDIVIRQRLEIAKPVFTNEEYASVKEFFKKMMDMLREPLVLKSK